MSVGERLGAYRRSLSVVRGWLVGLRRGGPVYGGYGLLEGYGASVVCSGMFGVQVWCGVAVCTHQWQGFLIQFWVLVGR